MRPFPLAGPATAALLLCPSSAWAQAAQPAGPAAPVPVLGGGLAPGQDGGLRATTRAASGPTTYIRRSRWDCADFSRKPDASWSANRAVAFPAPEGLLKVDQGAIYRIGQVYGGYDLAAMLEHDCPKG